MKQVTETSIKSNNIIIRMQLSVPFKCIVWCMKIQINISKHIAAYILTDNMAVYTIKGSQIPIFSSPEILECMCMYVFNILSKKMVQD